MRSAPPPRSIFPKRPRQDEVLSASFGAAASSQFRLTNETIAATAAEGRSRCRDGPSATCSFPGAGNIPSLTRGDGVCVLPFSPSRWHVRIVPGRSPHEQNYPALSIDALPPRRRNLLRDSWNGASGEADTGQPAMTALKVGTSRFRLALRRLRVYFSGMPSMTRSPPPASGPARRRNATHCRSMPHAPARSGSAISCRRHSRCPRLASTFTPKSSTRY